MGFSDDNPSRYGLSLILGTKEFTMEEIGKLYSGLANFGDFRSPIYIDVGTRNFSKESRYLSKGSSYLTLNTIKKLERPGMETLYKEKNPISWKTGTSHGRRDGWAVGVTPDWTLVVWVGNFTGEGNSNLTGVYSAGNLLFRIMKILPKKQREFQKPNDLVKIKVDEETGYRLKYQIPSKEILYPIDAKPLRISPYYKKIFVDDNGQEIDSRDENFLNRKEKIILNYPIEVINFFIRNGLDVSNIFGNTSKKKGIKIIYPTNGLRITIPKDFDGEKDLIIKIANLKNQNLYWYLNGEYLDKTRDREKNLKLGNGKYQLTIISEEGDIEKINFEILR